MKTKYLLCILLAGWIFTACNEDEKITPRVTEIRLRYEFPQGNQAHDKIAENIYKKYGVCLIYKDIDSMDFRRSWTNISNYKYTALPLSDEQVQFQIEFMDKHIFPFIPVDICRQILPFYYYLLSDLQRKDNSSTTKLINYTGGIDYWVSSMFTTEVPEIPNAEKQKEHRIRIFKQILETALIRGRITIPKEFNEGLNYTTALNTWNTTDANYFKTRGFPGNAVGDVYALSTPYSMPSTEQNFIAYLFLGLRYTEAELPAADYANYPLISKKRTLVLNYMKEKYGFDLATIAAGPEL